MVERFWLKLPIRPKVSVRWPCKVPRTMTLSNSGCSSGEPEFSMRCSSVSSMWYLVQAERVVCTENLPCRALVGARVWASITPPLKPP